MSALGGDEHEISLPEHELDLVDGPVRHEPFQIVPERRYPVLHAGFVADAVIPVEEERDLAVVAADVDGLVLGPYERLALFGVRTGLRLGRPVLLSVSALVRETCIAREAPMLDDHAVVEPEDVEEHAPT